MKTRSSLIRLNRFKRTAVTAAFVCFISIFNGYSETSLRGDGTILLDGEPFLPFGFYGPHWESSLEGRFSSIKTAVQAGFNTLHLSAAGEGFADILDTAEKYELQLIVDTPYPPNLAGTIDYYKDRDCIWAWTLADDGDNGSFTLDEIKGFNADAHSRDPGRLTFLTLTGWNAQRRDRAGEFAQAADIIANQIYPITPLEGYDVTQDNALTETYLRTLNYVLAAEANGRALVTNTQTFNWSGRHPTPEEERNMTYSVLAAGAKGLVCYNYPGARENEDLWAELEILRGEVISMAPVLLDGQLTRVETGDPELVASIWEHEDIFYTVLVNTSYNETKQISLPVPDGFTGELQLLFPRLRDGLAIEEDMLTGEINPVEVQAYQFASATSVFFKEKLSDIFKERQDGFSILNFLFKGRNLQGRILINR
jgi:hypothetical protein